MQHVIDAGAPDERAALEQIGPRLLRIERLTGCAEAARWMHAQVLDLRATYIVGAETDEPAARTQLLEDLCVLALVLFTQAAAMEMECGQLAAGAQADVTLANAESLGHA